MQDGCSILTVEAGGGRYFAPMLLLYGKKNLTLVNGFEAETFSQKGQ